MVAGTDTLPRLVPAPVRRWAVQVLAGPALTYRRLGAPAGAAPPRVASLFDRTGAAAAVATLERPAVGFGAQVQVRRELTGRWALSTGLGYHEYATSLALTTVVATGGFPVNASVPPRNDSTTTRFRLRDTYRFLTVPVRLGYQLGAGGRHLRIGVLAGADVAFYLGGATTEGSACGCATQPWGRTGSPYRPLSLALSLGADLRYQLGPRWELLAQPTATYFLTSLARPVSGYAPRHLLGGSTLLGFSYGLR